MSLSAAIRTAEKLLPGRPAPHGTPDPRWQAIIAVSEFIKDEPEDVWQFARRWSAHGQDDVRAAIATCIVEHLLERQFNLLFEWVEVASKRRCSIPRHIALCEARAISYTKNAKRLDRLLKEARRAS